MVEFVRLELLIETAHFDHEFGGRDFFGVWGALIGFVNHPNLMENLCLK